MLSHTETCARWRSWATSGSGDERGMCHGDAEEGMTPFFWCSQPLLKQTGYSQTCLLTPISKHCPFSSCLLHWDLLLAVLCLDNDHTTTSLFSLAAKHDSSTQLCIWLMADSECNPFFLIQTPMPGMFFLSNLQIKAGDIPAQRGNEQHRNHALPNRHAKDTHNKFKGRNL